MWTGFELYLSVGGGLTHVGSHSKSRVVLQYHNNFYCISFLILQFTSDIKSIVTVFLDICSQIHLELQEVLKVFKHLGTSLEHIHMLKLNC